MKYICYPVMLIAACGFILSLSAHICSILGIEIPGGNAVFALHGGIFVVWIPTVLVSAQLMRHANSKDFWKIALLGCPVGMKRAFYGIFAYGIVNFILGIVLAFSTNTSPTDSSLNGGIRLFSGHWMIFYYTAFAVMYSVIHAPHLYRKQKCKNGHAVSPIAKFCPECGSEVAEAK